MFRQIEVIREGHAWYAPHDFYAYKVGINSFGPELDNLGLKAPDLGSINARFYFTEAGWKQVGKKIISALGKQQVRYWVIAVKESSVDILYRDRLQVAVRPRKREK